MIDIHESRKKIDEVDQTLLELFETRMKLAADIAEYKRNTGKAVFDPAREEEKLAALRGLTKNELYQTSVTDLFTQIMSMSRRLQYSMLTDSFSLGFTPVDQFVADETSRVFYYGEEGSYTEQAMLEYFQTKVISIPMGSFGDIMQAVKEGRADYGVLPIENSSTGTLSDIFDLLAEYDNVILGEHVIKIEHNLWGLPGAETSQIRKVYSHPQGLLQCSSFLKNQTLMKPVAGGSTAGSARRVLEEGDITQAAIASRRAGEKLGLKLLQASIQNDETNSTRFIIISNQKIYKKESVRTSLCFVLPHTSGSLYHMLSHFIYNKINMTRIESRPIPGKAFEYRFFVDIQGCIDDPAVKNALHCIRQEALEMKILGCFLPVRP